VRRIPIPTESEKKACPNAALQRTGSARAEKSGLKRYIIPSANPERVVPIRTRIISMMKQKGIRTFEILSIPFRTPRETMIPVRNAARRKNRIGRYDSVNRVNGGCHLHGIPAIGEVSR
jgi:hypothetical protein